MQCVHIHGLRSVRVQFDLIYDVGAHKGEDTGFYLGKGYSVVAIEALPDLAKGIEARFHEEIDAGRLIVICAAVAPEAGTVEFFVNRHNSVWGTINAAWAKRNEGLGAPSDIHRVAAVRFDDVLREHGMPYYLKVDIEGADLLCLEALRQFSSRPRYVSIESEMVRWDSLCQEFALFQSLGYEDFKVIKQGAVTMQTPPNPAREGRYVAHTFTEGSSGLFGEELPGEWLTRERAIEVYRRIFVSYRFLGGDTLAAKIIQHVPIARRILPSWYDTHARHRDYSNRPGTH
jgi:FkbM family methyltransferase